MSTQCSCEYSTRFLIAEREHAGCVSETAHTNCEFLLESFKENSRFVLKLTATNEEIPHGKQMRIQIGGLLGLQKLVQDNEAGSQVQNVHAVVQSAFEKYGSLKNIPFNEIVKSITGWKGRRG
ncbi:MAG: hypothetical protein OEY35_02770 [Gammaproteobacteria bacterium]|nr:hypothetical protein [Gammaproteobacteria bacterium]MDH5613934.1 hypothetical protein [Gammaproteobacteria bacterium]